MMKYLIGLDKNRWPTLELDKLSQKNHGQFWSLDLHLFPMFFQGFGGL